MAGALDGITVVELAGIGPGPFAGTMLADHGARVIRIVRPMSDVPAGFGKYEILGRNRELRELDLKDAEELGQLRTLLRNADAMIEGFRPGTLERLGLSPDRLLADNPRLVIGRMTGWGQEGPLAHRAGHDIDYIALSGALHAYGRQGEKPTFPCNAVGDYGGGGMMLAFGVLAGIISARNTGKGQVVDCAMLDGAAIISSTLYMMVQTGLWQDERGVNLIDSGAPYYETYETADGKHVAIGPLEDAFYGELLQKLGLADDRLCLARADPANWPAIKRKFADVFRSRTRDQWCALLEDTDCCFAPVLSLAEAPGHRHNVARHTFIEVDGVLQPAPAPRFSATPAPPVRMPQP